MLGAAILLARRARHKAESNTTASTRPMVEHGAGSRIIEGQRTQPAEVVEGCSHALPDDVAEDGADQAVGHCFGDEEGADVQWGQPQRRVDVDFAFSFGDGTHHGVEDNQGGDEQGDGNLSGAADGGQDRWRRSF